MAQIPLLLLALFACPPTPDTGGETEPLPCGEVDDDQDGYDACQDCDDDDDAVYPGAEERCNGVDDDCDEALAPGEDDLDGDELPDCHACAEAGFWVSTRELDDAEDALDVLSGLTTGLSCDYGSTTHWMFTRLDRESGEVRCVYTGRTTPVGDDKPDSDDMNTEHTWPQSEGASAYPAKCDLHHLYPTDATANTTRAAHPFGEVVSGTSWSVGGSSLGDDSGGDTVFEPRDDHKGNVARSMVYFAMRYGYTLPSSQLELFAAWHAQDPVDADELERTQMIADYQAFPNPFVVCPGMMELVAGE